MWILTVVLAALCICDDACAFEFPTTGFQVLVEIVSSTRAHSTTLELPIDAWVVDPNHPLPPTVGTERQYLANLRTDIIPPNYREALSSKKYCGTIAAIDAREKLYDAALQDHHTWIWRYCAESSSPLSLDFQEAPGRNEVICLEGPLGQAVQGLGSLPPGLPIIWKPDNSWTMVDVWKFRSLGCRGIWLDAIETDQYRKLKRPCSAMDYPPTIFMIGEDEIS